MHFHRDLLAVCDTYGRHVLRPEPPTSFIGSPPLAFTFGSAGWCCSRSASARQRAAGARLARGPAAAIARHRATVCFTAPTAWRDMAARARGFDLRSLRKCVSAGEALPAPVFEAWRRRPA
jgi:2-aminobenzoate-CoA ligase